VKAGRASAKFAFTDQISLTAMAMVQNTKADAPTYYTAPTLVFSPSRNRASTRHYAREPTGNNMDMYELAFEDKTSYGTYTLTASRLDRDFHYTRDSTAVINLYLGLPVETTGAA